MRIKFTDVGRDKKSWDQEISEPLTEQKLRDAVKKKKAIASRFPDFEDDGSIWAGMRIVGKFEVLEAS